MKRERLERLMVKVVDGTASAAEREELMAVAVQDPELARELDEHRALKALTDGWVQRLEADLAEDAQRESRVSRGVAGLGVALLLIALAVLTGGGVVELFLDPEVPGWARLGSGMGAGGAVLLLGWALVWRLRSRAKDRYTEVVR